MIRIKKDEISNFRSFGLSRLNSAYDDNGNLTSISGTGGKTFTYTANNLVNTIVGGSNTSTMTWDSAGNRVKLVTSGSSTYGYVYNPLAGIPAVIEEVTPSGSVYYVREPNGALLARCTSATAVANYYHFDELGSTLFLTNSSALVTDEYTYDPWGNVTSHSGSLNQPYQFVGKYGYYTHYNDSNVPYIQTGVRLYFPQLGRYVQVDQIVDGINMYSYVSSKVIQLYDPDGFMARNDDGSDDFNDSFNNRDKKYYTCVAGCLITTLLPSNPVDWFKNLGCKKLSAYWALGSNNARNNALLIRLLVEKLMKSRRFPGGWKTWDIINAGWLRRIVPTFMLITGIYDFSSCVYKKCMVNY